MSTGGLLGTCLIPDSAPGLSWSLWAAGLDKPQSTLTCWVASGKVLRATRLQPTGPCAGGQQWHGAICVLSRLKTLQGQGEARGSQGPWGEEDFVPTIVSVWDRETRELGLGAASPLPGLSFFSPHRGASTW